MKLRGIGIGSMLYGLGYGFARPDFASAAVDVAFDGSVTLRNGASELGQGLRTILCQFVADELGVRFEDVTIVSADTEKTPDSGPVSASRATYVQGNAVVKACQDLKSQLGEIAAELLACSPDRLTFGNGRVYDREAPSKGLPFAQLAAETHARGKRFQGYGWHKITTPDVDTATSQGDAYATYAWASQLAEVEVDTETGKVIVLRLASATDAGKAINPKGVEGQIEGSVHMGMGQALTEEMKYQKGQLLNGSLLEYKIPTSIETPEIEAIVVESIDPEGPLGAKECGEGALAPVIPAIATAIHDAVGVRLREVPMTPERVLAAIEKSAKTQSHADS